MSPKMANMAPKTTQDRVQVGTKIEKNGFQEGFKKRTKKCIKKGDAVPCEKLQEDAGKGEGGPLNN